MQQASPLQNWRKVKARKDCVCVCVDCHFLQPPVAPLPLAPTIYQLSPSSSPLHYSSSLDQPFSFSSFYAYIFVILFILPPKHQRRGRETRKERKKRFTGSILVSFVPPLSSWRNLFRCPNSQPIMDQWQAYPDSSAGGSSRRYNGNGYNAAQQHPQQHSQQSQVQQHSTGYSKYEGYQGSMNPQSSAASSLTSPQIRDGSGDVAMSDAHDPYTSMKYPMRPHHQHHSSVGRATNLQQEPSQAAQRYSPMEALSPTSPYAAKSVTAAQYSNPPVQRQSPTRQAQSDYNPTSPYFANRQSQPLPSFNLYSQSHDAYASSSSSAAVVDNAFGDAKSPRRSVPQMITPGNKGPVPEFKKLRSSNDLCPKVNSQPPFRRANPEGGFISVILPLSVNTLTLRAACSTLTVFCPLPASPSVDSPSSRDL